MFTACFYLNGEYGYKDIYLGVLVILGKNGVERVIELDLDYEGKERFGISKKDVESVLTLL